MGIDSTGRTIFGRKETVMDKTHDHEWIYDGPVCCGHRLKCSRSDCIRGTKVSKVVGNPKLGDPMRLLEDGQTAERIGTRVA